MWLSNNLCLFSGNLARNLYSKFAELYSETTGIPLTVIQNSWYMYVAGTSKLPICPEKFERLATSTENAFRNAINWHPLNISWLRAGRHWAQMMRMLPPTITLGHLSEVRTI